MIKLTQVVRANQNDEFYLRETSLNPHHIVSVNPSDQYIMLLHQNKLPEGLNPDHQFVEISLSHGGSLIAVGTPQIINEKIKFAKKLLLG
tara:strand:+ start:75 stop:344 length:270 start_codon:yes stop_codon:yes gene_type:complete